MSYYYLNVCTDSLVKELAATPKIRLQGWMKQLKQIENRKRQSDNKYKTKFAYI